MSLTRWTLFNTDIIYFIGGISAAIGFIVYWPTNRILEHIREPKSSKVIYFLALTLGAALIGPVGARFINASLATAPKEDFQVEILERHVLKGDESNSYYITVSQTKRTPQLEIQVNSSTFRSLNSTALMTVQEGALGWDWMVDIKPEPEKGN